MLPVSAFDRARAKTRVWFQKFDPSATKQLTVKVPDNRNATPPGHYMVFFVNNAGVPSIAPIVQILPDKGEKENTPPKPAAASSAPSNTSATSTTATTATATKTRSIRMAATLPELNKQMIDEKDKPAVTVGVVPVCPYGLAPC